MSPSEIEAGLKLRTMRLDDRWWCWAYFMADGEPRFVAAGSGVEQAEAIANCKNRLLAAQPAERTAAEMRREVDHGDR